MRVSLYTYRHVPYQLLALFSFIQSTGNIILGQINSKHAYFSGLKQNTTWPAVLDNDALCVDRSSVVRSRLRRKGRKESQTIKTACNFSQAILGQST